MPDVLVTLPEDRDVIVLDNGQPAQIATLLIDAAVALGLDPRVIRVQPYVGGFVAPASVVATIDVTPEPPEGPPTITTIEPNTGPVAGGNTVTITGTNYSTVTWVLFENNQATDIDILSPTQVTVTAPAGVVGPVSVQVMNAAGQAAMDTDGYTYEDDGLGDFTWSIPGPLVLLVDLVPVGDVGTTRTIYHWGDGSAAEEQPGGVQHYHNYAAAGQYEVRIEGWHIDPLDPDNPETGEDHVLDRTHTVTVTA